jgi:hypothetical protein
MLTRWTFFANFSNCRTRSEDSVDRIGRKSPTECAASRIRRGGYAERNKCFDRINRVWPGEPDFKKAIGRKSGALFLFMGRTHSNKYIKGFAVQIPKLPSISPNSLYLVWSSPSPSLQLSSHPLRLS